MDDALLSPGCSHHSDIHSTDSFIMTSMHTFRNILLNNSKDYPCLVHLWITVCQHDKINQGQGEQ